MEYKVGDLISWDDWKRIDFTDGIDLKSCARIGIILKIFLIKNPGESISEKSYYCIVNFDDGPATIRSDELQLLQSQPLPKDIYPKPSLHR